VPAVPPFVPAAPPLVPAVPPLVPALPVVFGLLEEQAAKVVAPTTRIPLAIQVAVLIFFISSSP
jgi:hypothetical protein